MHLRSITLKGFKSFPDRTSLEFSPGVSVIVGPNGSGKSNITDAVLWVLGEQSPLALRGQSMRDVIFAGGTGQASRSAAEVEVVIDNGDGGLESQFSELSIVRRLERSGEGEYRLNGARCRLVDVLEVLSDTGLGREMHSVVSQGRIEAIVHSRPRERRLLIEEAAGLSKHRKRRRRAELKLARTEANLERALDVEREARSRLRPLKRQAEAAELHERLERQSLEARLELSREAVRATGAELAAADVEVAAAQAERDEAEARRAAVTERREAAEQAIARRARVREAVASRLLAARSAAERIAMRRERATETAAGAADEASRLRRELALLEQAPQWGDPAPEAAGERMAELEAELSELESAGQARLEEDLAAIAAERQATERRRDAIEREVRERACELRAAAQAADVARAARRDAEREVEAARREAAAVGAELAAVNQFLGSANGTPRGAFPLSAALEVETGYELPVAAALGPLLTAALVADVEEGEAVLDRAGGQGAAALVAPGEPGSGAASERGARPGDGDHGPAPQPATLGGPPEPRGRSEPPGPGAERLLDRVNPRRELRPLLERLLEGAWIVDSLEGLAGSFAGVAVTRSGRVLSAATGELHQAPSGGAERILESQHRRAELLRGTEEAAAREAAAAAEAERAAAAVADADAARESAEDASQAARHRLAEAGDAVATLERTAARRREAPDEGPGALRRAELAAELRAERRLAELAERERRERRLRRARLGRRMQRTEALSILCERAGGALEAAEEAVAARRDALAQELDADEAAGQRSGLELRSCAAEEAELQGRLKSAGDAVTTAAVRAQRARDAASEAAGELQALSSRLGFEPEPRREPLGHEQRAELEARIERLGRRRDQLGPSNPLARAEYEEAARHLEELEAGRRDLETAIEELEALIRDTDRRIEERFEETFEVAQRNFEEVVPKLFPGGRGRLRLAQPDGPRAVSAEGDTAPSSGLESADGDADDGALAAEGQPPLAREGPGVEVEVTPAGKATRRLSLLSGGEKSLVALAFMFAVFLARPCPFYVLDEVEAALDDLNIDRFLALVRAYADRAQFIVVTHQKRTMDAADRLYGVSMGGDGVSRVVSRRLSPAPAADEGVRVAA